MMNDDGLIPYIFVYLLNNGLPIKFNGASLGCVNLILAVAQRPTSSHLPWWRSLMGGRFDEPHFHQRGLLL